MTDAPGTKSAPAGAPPTAEELIARWRKLAAEIDPLWPRDITSEQITDVSVALFWAADLAERLLKEKNAGLLELGFAADHIAGLEKERAALQSNVDNLLFDKKELKARLGQYEQQYAHDHNLWKATKIGELTSERDEFAEDLRRYQDRVTELIAGNKSLLDKLAAAEAEAELNRVRGHMPGTDSDWVQEHDNMREERDAAENRMHEFIAQLAVAEKGLEYLRGWSAKLADELDDCHARIAKLEKVREAADACIAIADRDTDEFRAYRAARAALEGET